MLLGILILKGSLRGVFISRSALKGSYYRVVKTNAQNELVAAVMGGLQEVE
jgi:hypothetical protein